MRDTIKKRDKRVRITWTNWGRTYRASLSVEKSAEAIRVFKSNVEEKTLMQCMTPIYKDWEKHHEMGEKGVYKPSDLIQLYNIKEV